MRVGSIGSAFVAAFLCAPAMAGEVAIEVRGSSVSDGVVPGFAAIGAGLGADLNIGPTLFVGAQGTVERFSNWYITDGLPQVAINFPDADSTEWAQAAVLRAGIRLKPGIKLYALGGYMKTSYFDQKGFQFGAGGQAQIWRGLYGKLEYRHSNGSTGSQNYVKVNHLTAAIGWRIKLAKK